MPAVRRRVARIIDIRYNVSVIRSFADKLTEELFHGDRTARTRRISPDVLPDLARKFAQLDAATRLDDLRMPPGNRLEALRGNLDGRHSIRVNDQWRIVFRWEADGPHDVQFIDYH